jgi:hypothetical protein
LMFFHLLTCFDLIARDPTAPDAVWITNHFSGSTC